MIHDQIIALLKATKGTPQYDEWYRKYIEKRGKKGNAEEAKKILSKKNPVEDLNAIYSDVNNKEEQIYKIAEELQDSWSEEGSNKEVSLINSISKQAKNIGSDLDKYKSNLQNYIDGKQPKAFEIPLGPRPIPLETKFVRNNPDLQARIKDQISEFIDSKFKSSGAKKVKLGRWNDDFAKFAIDKYGSDALIPSNNAWRSITDEMATTTPKAKIEDKVTQYDTNQRRTVFEKAQKGTAEYEEWLRKYHEKRRKKQEENELAEKKAREAAETLEKRRNNLRNLQYHIQNSTTLKSDAKNILIGDTTYPREVIGTDEFNNNMIDTYGGNFPAFYDADKYNEYLNNPVKPTSKDWVRMISQEFSRKTSKAVADQIDSKDKAIARYAVSAKLYDSTPDLTDKYLSSTLSNYPGLDPDAFAVRALALGATPEELRAAQDSIKEIPEQYKEMHSKFKDHKYGHGVGSVTKLLDKEIPDLKYKVTSGNAVTGEGRDAMRRNGRKWTIGHIIEGTKPDGTPFRYSFDEITDEGGGPSYFSTGSSRDTIAQVVNSIKNSLS